MKIKELLSKRSDLSSFLVHLTRAHNQKTAEDNLVSMVQEQTIKAYNAFGLATDRGKHGDGVVSSQRCVCFTETPLEYLHLLTENIDGRQVELSSYGIGIPKMLARRRGCNPVWYIDNTPGHDWLTNQINDLIAQSDGDSHNPIFKLTPFMETMGSGYSNNLNESWKKEFWWEREWRHVGDFSFPPRVIVFCPEDRMQIIRNRILGTDDVCDITCAGVQWVDLSWSLEELVGRSLGFSMSDLSPL